MADHSKPTTTSTYVNFVSELDGRLDDISLGLDPAVTTATNLATNSIRWTSASNKWQKYNGTTWADLSSAYSINIDGTVGATTPASGAFTTLSATGNVTLGDASGDTVTINGTVGAGVVISGSTATDALRITQTGAGNSLVVEDSTNPDSSPFVIDTSGSVGIGTLTPTGKLHIAGTISSAGWLVKASTNASSANESGIYVDASNNIEFAARNGSNTLTLRLGSTGDSYINAGNVGIGLTSPPSKLAISGAGGTTGDVDPTTSLGATLMIGDTGTASGNGGAIIFSANGTSWRFAAIKGLVTTGGSNAVGDIVFSTRIGTFGSTLTESMRIKSGGYVGIGTSNPITTLHVRSGTDRNFNVTSSQVLANAIHILSNNDTGISAVPIQFSYGTNLAFFDNGTERMRIASGGGISFGSSGTAYGTSGQVLTSQGNSPPTWTTISGTGTLIRAPRILTSGTSYTTPAGCTAIYVEMVGGGGGGGNPAANPGYAGSGGGAAYCAKYFTVTGNTAYTYAIGGGGNGAGPANGSTSNGGTGGSTTFTVGATTITAGGGGGSTGPTALVGGVGGTATNGDVNITGAPGSRGNSSWPFPLGGAAPVFGVSTSNPSTTTQNAGGYGSGGPSSGNTSVKSGNGSAGLIRIWEFT